MLSSRIFIRQHFTRLTPDEVLMLLCTPTGAHVELTGLRFFRKMQRTHDLTVEGVHAYYVLAGTAPLLVHHCDSISMEEAVHRAGTRR
ncbi:hypothetical protein ACWCYZ_35115 [Streptomyces virginiae]